MRVGCAAFIGASDALPSGARHTNCPSHQFRIDVGIHEEIIFRFTQISTMQSSSPHIPVLLEEVLTIFKRCDGYQMHILLDATLGAGGHAGALLREHGEVQQFIGGDRDPHALDLARHQLAGAKLLPSDALLWHCNFAQIPERLHSLNIQCDAALVDLGVSTMQLTSTTRGFSLHGDAPLDMRMDPDQDLTAAKILNQTPQKKLEDMLRESEVRGFRRLAAAICHGRQSGPIQTTDQLLKIVSPHLGPRKKIHPATLLFQALRIAVNQELVFLGDALKGLAHSLSVGGRLAAISFNSLEDRIVKFAFKELCFSEEFYLVTPKPLVPGPLECRRNRRCRSAKLRAIMRTQGANRWTG